MNSTDDSQDLRGGLRGVAALLRPLVYSTREPRRGPVLSFSVDAGRIVAVDVARNPDRLRHLDFLAAVAAPQSKRSTKAFSSR